MKKLAWVIGIVMCTCMCMPVSAHDQKHPQNNEWMKELHNNSGIPCCDGDDATRLENVDWQTVCEAGTGECHFQVRIENHWWNVPPNAVLSNPNQSGVALVWPVFYGEYGSADRDIIIRCFLPGAGT